MPNPASSTPRADAIVLSPAAQRAWRDGQSFEQYVNCLLNANLVHDAIRVLSAALASRDLIWWSALCVWAVRGSSLSSVEDGVLRAVVRWVFDPSAARHAETAKCRETIAAESALYSLAAAVVMADDLSHQDPPLSESKLAMGRRAAQSAIFEMVELAQHPDQKRYLGYFGLVLLKSPRHWAA